MKIGIIGCGNISKAYVPGSRNAREYLTVKACADLRMEAAEAKAKEYCCQAMTVDELLADPEIELVINLTIPAVHVEVGKKILDAGKHVYAEKPLGLDFAQGKELLDYAEAKGLRVGSAPDTFLFAGGQTTRKLIDDGRIGRPCAATAFFCTHGTESWHPNPAFFYSKGGGPLYDMGPYYMTAMVNFFGPAKSVTANCGRSMDERPVTSPTAKVRSVPVEVNTHYTGVVEFEGGVLVTVMISFDVWKFDPMGITIHGTEGSIDAGDPNSFEKAPKVCMGGESDWSEVPLTHGGNQRMFGVLEMADAIRNNRPHRANGELALHVLEIFDAFVKASESGQRVEIKTQPPRPEALPAGLPAWKL